MVDFVLIKEGIETPVQCKSSWAEIDVETYLRLLNEDDGQIERVCSILSGVDVEVIMALPAKDFMVLAPICFFVYDRTELVNASVMPKGYEDWYIGDQPWSKLEACNKALAAIGPQNIIEQDEEGNDYIAGQTKGKESFNAAKDIVKEYTGIDISGKPILEVFGLANFFLSSYLIFTTALKN